MGVLPGIGQCRHPALDYWSAADGKESDTLKQTLEEEVA